MIQALLYGRVYSLRNRLFSWGRRLRQPKYLASFLAGACYVYFIFLRRSNLHLQPGSLPPDLISTIGAFILLALFFVYAVTAWLGAAPEARLKFTEAEIAFLFPAPLSRRRLIHFNLLSSQFTILLSSLVLTVILNRWRFLGGNALTRAVGWWIILSSISLFHNAAVFIASRAVEWRGAQAKRQGLMLLSLLAVIAGRRLWATARIPEAFDPRTLPSAFAHFVAGWLQAGFGPALRPVGWIIAPFAAPTTGRFLLALPLALLFPALCYAVIVWLQVPFRDGTIAAAGLRAKYNLGRRQSGLANPRPVRKALRSPFALASTGRPETAFLWKNLIGIQSWFNLRIAVSLAVLVTVVVVNLSRLRGLSADRGAATMLLVFAAIAAFYIMLLGPQMVRQDLRSDLLNADLLKVYPLEGWQIVGGQMLTPALLLSLLLWLTALVFGWAILGAGALRVGPGYAGRVTLLICIGCAIPPVVMLQLIVPNAAALLFPAWHQNARSRSAGIEAIGQRLIFTLGQFVAVLVALLPAAILAGLVAFASIYWIGWVAGLILATAAMLVVVGGEVWVGLWWLGRLFERLDIAMELKP